MNRRVVWFGLILMALVITPLYPGETVSGNKKQDERASWIEGMQVANIVALLPELPPSGELTESEWNRLIASAHYLTSVPEAALEWGIVHYMMATLSEGNGRSASWSKPLILLRVMYEIPQGARMNHELSSFRGEALLRDDPIDQRVIDFSNDQLKLRRWRFDGDWEGAVYEPQKELRYFRQHFRLRDLSPWLDRETLDAIHPSSIRNRFITRIDVSK